MFDHLILQPFLPAGILDEIMSGLRAAAATPAAVYGTTLDGNVDARVRRARRLDVSNATRQRIAALLEERRDAIGSHFGVTLTSFEEPQFLRYEAGDFFVAHQDGNTALIRDDTRHRRVSIVLFLNDAYEGGELTFHGAYPDWQRRFIVPAAPGSLVAFPSETTHEVTPVTAGERYTCVSWYR